MQAVAFKANGHVVLSRLAAAGDNPAVEPADLCANYEKYYPDGDMSQQADVYALGVIMHVAFTWKWPPKSLKQLDDSLPDFVRDVLPKMLGDKTKRPTAYEVLSTIAHEDKPTSQDADAME